MCQSQGQTSTNTRRALAPSSRIRLPRKLTSLRDDLPCNASNKTCRSRRKSMEIIADQLLIPEEVIGDPDGQAEHFFANVKYRKSITFETTDQGTHSTSDQKNPYKCTTTWNKHKEIIYFASKPLSQPMCQWQGQTQHLPGLSSLEDMIARQIDIP